MRILLAHNNYKIYGGAEVFYHEVGRILKINGNEVAYFSSQEGDVDSEWKQYFPKAPDYKKTGMLSGAIRMADFIYNQSAKKDMARLIKDFKPDIIHVFAIYVKLTPSILVAAREAGVPVVMSCNDYKIICPNYKLYHHQRICMDCKGGRFYNAIINRCCHDSIKYSIASAIESYAHEWMDIYKKNVHTFLFASDFMAQTTEKFWGVGSFRWKKLKNPFDSLKYGQSNNVDGPVIFLGRLIEEKGMDVLLNAAKYCSDIMFKIIGDGPDMARLQKITNDLKMKNVNFAGPKWGDEADYELQSCRFLVIPSVWHENYPYVINQAFAYGKPVIGADRGGIPELVKHGERGLIYEANDAQALAGHIKSLYYDARLTEKMGRNAKIFSDEEFNDMRFYQNLLGIYKGILS